MKNKFVKKQKGEKMNLRKVITLLLLVSFSVTAIAPAFAAAQLKGPTTVPTIAQDEGTKANGAGIEVLSIGSNLLIDNISSGEIVFQQPALAFASTTGATILNISSNGQLTQTDTGGAVNGGFAAAGSAARRAFVLKPPTGLKFVPLIADGYSSADVTLTVNGSFNTTSSLRNITTQGFNKTVLPSTGNHNGNVMLAGVTTLAAPTNYFGTGVTVPAGSLIMYTLTSSESGNPVFTGSGKITFTGIGLAADPDGDNALTLDSNVIASVVDVAGDATTFSTETVTLAKAGDNAGKTEFLMVGSNTGTETGATAQEDTQVNTLVLANPATTTTLNIGPGLITSSTTNAATLNLDTDALVLRAAERRDSTVDARTYYQTPFATTAFVSASPLTANGSISTLNTALTDTTLFPNTAKALITVEFKLVDASNNAVTGPTLVVNAASVTLSGARAFNSVRNTGASVGGQTQSLATNGGFMGNVVNVINGLTATKTRYGVGVIYNGTSASSALVMRDIAALGYAQQTIAMGFNGRTSNTVVPAAVGTTTVSVNPTTQGIFPGSLIAGYNNGDTTSLALVNVANGSGASSFTFDTDTPDLVAGTSWTSPEAIFSPSEVTARLVNSSGATTNTNAWFAVFGNQNNTDITLNGRRLLVGGTNLSTNINYLVGPTVNGTTASKNANNAIAVARLDGTKLYILPISNKYDAIRDALLIRPEIQITGLTSAVNTAGFKVVAVASGGNISGTKTITVAEVSSAGKSTIGLDIKALPVHGDLSSLMAENNATSLSRAAIALSGVTGASTSLDSIDDLVAAAGTGLKLDDTLPPLFCGGTAGSKTVGPNGVVIQPKGRMILVTESTPGEFDKEDDITTNTVLRFLLPTGMDLNLYGTTANIVSAISTGAGSSTSTFQSSVSVAQAMNLNGGVTQAYVDVTIPSIGTPTQAATTKRSIGLVFKPNALVVPATQTDFKVTVQVIDSLGTTKTSDDILHKTVGQVAIASSCSPFMTIAYCKDAISSYGNSKTASNYEVDNIANGSFQTTFGGLTSAVRLLASTPATVTLPDICITEGVADAWPLGSTVEGVPTTLGETGFTTVALKLASSLNGTSTIAARVGLNGATASVKLNNASVVAAAPTRLSNNVGRIVLTAATGSTVATRPFLNKTQVRVKGLTLDKTSGGFIPPAQDIVSWIEAYGSGTSYAVGSVLPLSVNGGTLAQGTPLISISDTSEARKYANHFKNPNNYAVTTDILDDVNFADNSATNNDLSIVFGNTGVTAPILKKAAISIADGKNYDLLNETLADNFTVSLTPITGTTTDTKVTVSAGSGTLEPGSTLTLTTSGSGAQDSVFIPVVDDGSFIASVRATKTQQLTLTQTPTTGQSGADSQTVVLAVADVNVEPALASAIVDPITVLGTYTKRGTAPVVFTVVATGKVDGQPFVPTAAQLTLGGQPVYAIPGTTNKFIGIANLTRSGGLSVATTVGAKTSVSLTGLTTAFATQTGTPTLRSVTVNSKGILVIKGLNILANDLLFYLVSETGTATEITLAPVSSSDRKLGIRRSATTQSIPTTTLFGVVHRPTRGMSTRLLD